jgi:CheY-like chemotaxis protein
MSKSNLLLFVEDNEDILFLYKKIAGTNGVYAKNLQEAYEFYMDNHPAKVILDFNIKGEIPLDFIDFIKQDNPNIKIIVISAYSADIPLKFLKYDTDKVLTKPVSLHLLYDMFGASSYAN